MYPLPSSRKPYFCWHARPCRLSRAGHRCLQSHMSQYPAVEIVIVPCVHAVVSTRAARRVCSFRTLLRPIQALFYIAKLFHPDVTCSAKAATNDQEWRHLFLKERTSCDGVRRARERR